MKLYGVEWSIKSKPKLDPNFIPMEQFTRGFLKTAKQPLAIAIEREDECVSVYDTFIHGTPDMQQADFFYVERLVKFLLWVRGGFCVTICGNQEVYNHIKFVYSSTGRAPLMPKPCRMSMKALQCPHLPYEQKPAEKESSKPLGGHMDGCRIGFDAGGSDRRYRP